MMAFFLCIFSMWVWGVTCFHIMFYLVLVSNWNYNVLELSLIWCVILCPPACKLLFSEVEKEVYIVITQINNRVELLPCLRGWNGLLIIKFCGKLLLWYMHVYVFQELYPLYLCMCMHTHTHIHIFVHCWYVDRHVRDFLPIELRWKWKRRK
jgi:hypothetical protein